MAAYLNEITAIDITSLGELVARVIAFDECCSEVVIKGSLNTVESWRELSAQIEDAILAIHQPGSAKGGDFKSGENFNKYAALRPIPFRKIAASADLQANACAYR